MKMKTNTTNANLVDGLYSLDDLLDVNSFRLLADGFYHLTDFSISLFDRNANKMLFSIGNSVICSEFHRKSEVSNRGCTRCNRKFSDKLGYSGLSIIEMCEFGIYNAATPVFIEKTHIADLFLGQFLFEPPTESVFIEQAEKFQFDKENYLEASRKLPIVPREKVEAALDFVKMLAVTIAESGLNNLRQKRNQIVYDKTAQQLQFLTDSSTDVIFVLDQQGIQKYFSPSVEKVLGFLPESQIGLSFAINVPEEFLPAFNVQLQNVFSGEKVKSFESKIRHKNGHLVDVEITGHLVETNSEKLAQGVIRDISYRKAMQVAFNQLFERNKALIEAIPDMIFVIDYNGFFVDFVPSEATSTLVPPADFIGRHLSDVLPSTVVQGTLDAIQKLQETGLLQRFKYQLNTTEGIGYYEARMAPKYPDEIIILVRDVTQRTKAENELIEREQYFRQIFEDNALPKMIIDPENGRILKTNHAAEKFYGWSVETLEQMEISQINTMEQDKIIEMLKVVVQQKNFQYEFIQKKFDGSVCPVEVYGSSIVCKGISQIYIVIIDISERKKAIEEISLFSRIIEQINHTVVITNPDAEIQYVNPSFVKVSGYTFDEAKGQNPRLLKSGELGEAFYAQMWEELTAGKIWHGELLNKKKDGVLYWEKAHITPILDFKNTITHYVAIKEDITATKKLNEELTLSKEKAEESDRLKTAFLQNMSHEIRTPLNGILGFAQLLLDTQSDEAMVKYYSSIINKSGFRLLELINNIIDISKIESGTLKVLNESIMLNQLYTSVADLMAVKAKEKGIELNCEFSLPDQDSFIITDPVKLNQILTNLIGNALKYTQNGEITCAYEIHDNTILFRIEDTGSGIPQEQLLRIFDRFYQVDQQASRKFEGAGLGLAITQNLVKILGGDIWVESEVGVGTKFYFSLPYIEGRNLIQKNTTPPKSLSNHTLEILIAEDDDTSYIFVETVLKSYNVKIIRVADGQQALDYCSSTLPDIILMDINMPVMDGLTATKLIKKIHPSLPIIAQTAYAFTNEKNEALSAGCDAYLSKPIVKNELLTLIKNLVS